MKPASSVLVLALLLPCLPKDVGAQIPDLESQATGTIRGTVYSRNGSRLSPLPHAMVFLSGDGRLPGRGRYLSVTADSAGGYAVTDLRPGTWRLRALHVGYEVITTEVSVPNAGTVNLDLELAWRPIPLPPLLVTADPVRARADTRSPPTGEMAEVALRALEGTSGMAEGGLTQVVQSLPGNDPSDPQDVLLMRGSATDLKLVLLDGAPIYTPFHMAGLVESFDPQSLGSASLFLGGAPARFEGGLSYILDLQTRTPRSDRIQGNAAVDLLTGRFMAEGPLSSSTGFLVGSRAIHDLGTPLLTNGSTPYGYADFLGRFHWAGRNGTTAYVTGFWNQESVLLDLLSETANARALENDSESLGILGNKSTNNGARWGNQAVSAGLRGTLGETSAELRVAASRYDAELPVGDTLPLFAQSRSDRLRLTADFSRPWGEGALRFGASLDRQASTYSAMALDSAWTSNVSRLDLDGTSGGVYVEATRPLSQNVQLRAGVRADHYGGGFGLRGSPRLSLTWMLTDEAALTLAAGRYHQYSNLASQRVEETLGPFPPGTLPIAPSPLRLAVGAANHLVVSLDQLLTPSLRLGLEGFVKEFSGLMPEAGETLKASGVDLRVAREGLRSSGWLGYTLTWFWASDGLLSSGQSPFSGRHLLSAGLTTKLTERTGLEVRAGYGDGLPYTSVPTTFGDAVMGGNEAIEPNRMETTGDKVLNQAPQLTVGPDEGFFRLDVELYGLWSPTVGGRTMELRPYLRILNALNRRDALFYHFDPWRSGGPEPLADLPFLPLLGLEWRF